MGLLIEFGCSLYIYLRRAHTNMAHIGGKRREPGVDILAIATVGDNSNRPKNDNFGTIETWGWADHCINFPIMEQGKV
jgi:hypothetical protein